jgi:CDP-paratose synthetase
MNILITGANGYLGKHLCSSLLSDKNKISCYNRQSSLASIKEVAPDVVIHTICSYGRNNESASQIYKSNLLIGIDIIDELMKLDKPVTFINCGTSLKSNTNLYAFSKGQFIQYGKFVSNNKLKFININLQHFYGPAATNNFVSFVFEQCIKHNTLPLTEGIQERDFVYIDDVISAFKCIIKNKDILYNFENIDLGTGYTTQLKELIYKIHSITNSKSKLDFGKIPIRDNEELIMKADTTRLHTLNWNANITLDQGLQLIKDLYSEK